MKTWLVALRVARREAMRAKGRTLLVIVMIAMPVLALAFTTVSLATMKVSPAEQRTRMLGAAAGTLSFAPPQEAKDASDEVRPPATAALQKVVAVSPTFSDIVTMRTAAGVGTLNAHGIDTADPMTKGTVRVITGRTPAADDEVAVSQPALRRLGTKIGGQVSVYARAGDPSFPQHAYTVVGIVEISGQVQEDVLFRPSQEPLITQWYYATPLTQPQISELRAMNAMADGFSPQPPSAAVLGLRAFGVGTIITGLGVLEVVLLAGPAFAVGAKRRQRDLALVAANGAPPSAIRRIVLADGVVAGALAAACGVALGVLGAYAARGLIEEHLTHQRGGGFSVDAPALLAIAAIAIVTGLLGALVPAYTVGRQDVIEALSGRRGVTRSRAVWLVLGLAGVAVGALAAYLGAQRESPNMVLTGLIIGELGLVLCTPKLVGLVSRLGGVLPLAPRIALRDTARRRAAAAPAISAVMAAVAGSVALTVYLGASSARDDHYSQAHPTGSIEAYANTPDSLPAIDAVMRSALPGADLVRLLRLDCHCSVQPVLPEPLRCPFSAESELTDEQQRQARADKRCDDPFGDYMPVSPVSSGSDAGAMLGITGQDLSNAAAALNRGEIVITDPRYVDSSGSVQLKITTYSTTGDAGSDRVLTVRGVAIPTSSPRDMLIPASLGDTLDLKFQAIGVLAMPAAALDQRQADALDEALLTAGLNQAQIESGPPASRQSVALVLAVAAGIVALGAAAIATGLAAADSRNDLTTLGAVGASPRVRRQLSLAQSGVIALLGSALGVIAGFGAAAAILTGLNRVWASGWPAPSPYPILVPWLNLTVSLLIVPVIAMLGAGLLTRSRLPSERRLD